MAEGVYLPKRSTDTSKNGNSDRIPEESSGGTDTHLAAAQAAQSTCLPTIMTS